MRFLSPLRAFLRLPSDVEIHPQVRRHFKRNFIVNTLDGSFWLFGESFVSVATILPVFASTLTDSAILIGLVPALINAGWFIPQLFMVGQVKSRSRKLPFAKAMAVLERVPFLILPLTAFLLNWITDKAALWLFMVVIAWRGFASGMVALPWQEVIASVIPSPVRSRFFGLSRMVARVFGVIGSSVAGLILATYAYPNNYALSFLVGAALIWFSYFFFCQTIEPEPQKTVVPDVELKPPLIDLETFKRILGNDHNFRIYLSSRIFFQLGSMATGFLAVYGIQHFSLADEQAAVFSAILFASGMVGFLAWGVAGDRTGARNITVISDLLHIMALVLAFLSPSIWIFYVVFAIFGLSQSGSIVGDLVMGMGMGTEADRPAYLGLVRTVPGVFVLIAPLLGGALVEWVGYPVMFLIALGFALVGVVALFRVQGPQTV